MFVFNLCVGNVDYVILVAYKSIIDGRGRTKETFDRDNCYIVLAD